MSIYGVEETIFLLQDEPELATRFRDVILSTAIRYYEACDQASDPASVHPGFGFADDNCAMLTPDLYEFFALPILQGIFQRFAPAPADWRDQHSDSDMAHLLPLLARTNLGGANFGPTVRFAQIRAAMPRTIVDGTLAPFTMMRQRPSRHHRRSHPRLPRSPRHPRPLRHHRRLHQQRHPPDLPPHRPAHHPNLRPLHMKGDGVKLSPSANKVSKLHLHVDAFGFPTGFTQKKSEESLEVNGTATRLMAQLHETLRRNRYSGHKLAVLMVRLMFCFFADKTGIFLPLHSFTNILRRTRDDGRDVGPLLMEIFSNLDKPKEDRQNSLDPDIARLEHINGHLFADPEGRPKARF